MREHCLASEGLELVFGRSVTPDCPCAVRAFLACLVSRFVKPLASVTRQKSATRESWLVRFCGRVLRTMTLSLAAILVAAALTPRHSGAIAQR